MSSKRGDICWSCALLIGWRRVSKGRHMRCARCLPFRRSSRAISWAKCRHTLRNRSPPVRPAYPFWHKTNNKWRHEKESGAASPRLRLNASAVVYECDSRLRNMINVFSLSIYISIHFFLPFSLDFSIAIEDSNISSHASIFMRV